MQNDPNSRGVLLSTKEAARYLNFSHRTLEGWRIRGEGPPFTRLFNERIRYYRADLDDWIASQAAA